MPIILSAAPIKKKIAKNLKERCLRLKDRGVTPYLKVILVGENPASIIYTTNKKRFAEKVGAKCDIIKMNHDISENVFLSELKAINSDPNVHGLIIQLPLPKHLQHLDPPTLVSPLKDVDGFHSENIYQLLKGNSDSHFLSCTPKGILTLLNEYNIPLEGKHIVVIGRSMIVGKPLAMLLLNHNATVSICHSHTEHLSKITKSADIIVCAIGKKHFLTLDYLNESKLQVIVDVGINSNRAGELVGDADFDNIKSHCAAITPVPGGVGPMTIVSLIQNLLQAAEKELSI